jgi:uncharacterized repeat protein (TIGR01451 family)
MFALSRKFHRVAGFILLLGFTSLLAIALSTPQAVTAQTPSLLGDAESFGVLGGSTVTNDGPTVVNGNLGVADGTAIVGFDPPPDGPGTVTGTQYSGPTSLAADAQDDAATAYTTLAGLACSPSNALATELGGTTLVPAVYCLSTAGLTGQLTLNAQNNADAVFVFQVASTLITASNSSVLVINSGPTCNVWWQVGSSATLGSGTRFVGNILAYANIALGSGATLDGRALAQIEAVNLNNNVINPAACRRTQLTLTKSDGGGSVSPGGTINYTLNYQNTGTESLSDVILTETVPAGTTFNGAGGWVCAGSICTLSVGTLAANAGGSAVFSVVVSPGTTGTIDNSASIASGDTNRSASDSTPVTIPDDDDDDDNPTAVPAVPTAVPVVPTAIPGVVATLAPDATVTPVVIPGIVGTLVPVGVDGAGNPVVLINGTPVVIINGVPVLLVNGTPGAPFVAGVAAQAGVFGLPNTGGAAPQATYWLTTTPRP